MIDAVVWVFIAEWLHLRAGDVFPESEGMVWSEWQQGGQAIVDRALDALDMDTRREIVKVACSIEVFPVGRGCRKFALDSIRVTQRDSPGRLLLGRGMACTAEEMRSA